MLRTIALLPIVSKILEKDVFLQLVQYLDSNSLLKPNLHGSRQGHHSATNLVQMYDQWVELVEAGMIVGVNVIDFSAAFDMVDHQLLLEKLELFCLDSGALRWIGSYLGNRFQSVCVDGCLSPLLPVECGVPQGSILGPLFYILFTNDIPDLAHQHPVTHQAPAPYCKGCGSTVCNVDDCTFSHGVPVRDPHHPVQDHLRLNGCQQTSDQCRQDPPHSDGDQGYSKEKR